MTTILKKTLLRLIRKSFGMLSASTRLKLVSLLVESAVDDLPPREALLWLFQLDHRLYKLEGRESVRLGNGIHSKHRHLRYYEFFSAHIPPEAKVLDIGSGPGHMAFMLASARPDIEVTGIEILERSHRYAQEHYQLPNLRFVLGDVLQALPGSRYDTVTLSNVLEHIEPRVELLRRISRELEPTRLILRVPTYQRDWRVPLMDELGLDYRLDSTHCIEYTLESFSQEMREAVLEIVHLEVRWGEIWSVVEPARF